MSKVLTPEFINNIKNKFKEEHKQDLSDAELMKAAERILEQRRYAFLQNYCRPMGTAMVQELATGEWSTEDGNPIEGEEKS